MTTENKLYSIFAGLGGGFGGERFIETFKGTEEDAEKCAYEKACEEYDSYEGLHGLRTINDIMEEDNLDEEEAEEIYNQERESWLCYYIKEYEEGDEDK